VDVVTSFATPKFDGRLKDTFVLSVSSGWSLRRGRWGEEKTSY
jgi:hypothetical protein